jgi:UDP-hydrolysing UDP-N-acetyl-D-glucosamine 2-epimerase
MHQNDDTGAGMAKGVGIGIQKFTSVFQKIKPDITLVLGDRVEPFAATVASAFLNIPVAHIHGGDRAQAGFDDFMRHAITKFAHIHFPATQSSYRRIIKLGENPRTVFLTGSPSIDEIRGLTFLSKPDLSKHLKISLAGPILVLLQHSVSTQWREAKTQIQETLRAIQDWPGTIVAIAPNSDAGGRIMTREIVKSAKSSQFRFFTSLSRLEFLSLLKCAQILVGNSSCGVIESSSFKIPVVNIGDRQNGRERGVNVVDASHNSSSIRRAILKSLSPQMASKLRNCRNPYGDGRASSRIARILETIPINDKLLNKQIAY